MRRAAWHGNAISVRETQTQWCGDSDTHKSFIAPNRSLDECLNADGSADERHATIHTHTHTITAANESSEVKKKVQKKGGEKEKNCRSRSAKMTATTDDDGIHYYYCYYVLEKETIFTSFSLRHERFLA